MGVASFDLDLEEGGGSRADAKLKNLEDGNDDDDDDDDDDERECRVCHVSFAQEEAICLGCDCKRALALAHRRCAETWFKIKGNKICEICGTTACNVSSIEEPSFPDETESSPSSADERDGDIPMTSEEMTEWKSNASCCCLFAFLIVVSILVLLFRITLF